MVQPINLDSVPLNQLLAGVKAKREAEEAAARQREADRADELARAAMKQGVDLAPGVLPTGDPRVPQDPSFVSKVRAERSAEAARQSLPTPEQYMRDRPVIPEPGSRATVIPFVAPTPTPPKADTDASIYGPMRFGSGGEGMSARQIAANTPKAVPAPATGVGSRAYASPEQARSNGVTQLPSKTLALQLSAMRKTEAEVAARSKRGAVGVDPRTGAWSNSIAPKAMMSYEKTVEVLDNINRGMGTDISAVAKPVTEREWNAVLPLLETTKGGRMIIGVRNQQLEDAQVKLASLPIDGIKTFSDAAKFVAENSTSLTNDAVSAMVKQYGGLPEDPESLASTWARNERNDVAQKTVSELNADLSKKTGKAEGDTEVEWYGLKLDAKGNATVERKEFTPTEAKAIEKKIMLESKRAAYNSSGFTDLVTLEEYATAKDAASLDTLVKNREFERAVTATTASPLLFADADANVQDKVASAIGLTKPDYAIVQEPETADMVIAEKARGMGVSEEASGAAFQLPQNAETNAVARAKAAYLRTIASGGDKGVFRLANVVAEAMAAEFKAEGMDKDSYASYFRKIEQQVRSDLNADLTKKLQASEDAGLVELRPVLDGVDTEARGSLSKPSAERVALVMAQSQSSDIQVEEQMDHANENRLASDMVFSTSVLSPSAGLSGMSALKIEAWHDLAARNPTSPALPPQIRQAMEVALDAVSQARATQAKIRVDAERAEQEGKAKAALRLKSAGLPGGAIMSAPGISTNADGSEVYYAPPAGIDAQGRQRGGAQVRALAETLPDNEKQAFKLTMLDPTSGIIGGVVTATGIQPKFGDRTQMVIDGFAGEGVEQHLRTPEARRTMTTSLLEAEAKATAKKAGEALPGVFKEGDIRATSANQDEAYRVFVDLYQKTGNLKYWKAAYVAGSTAAEREYARKADLYIKAPSPDDKRVGAVRETAVNFLSAIQAITQDDNGRWVDVGGRPVDPLGTNGVKTAIDAWKNRMVQPDFAENTDEYVSTRRFVAAISSRDSYATRTLTEMLDRLDKTEKYLAKLEQVQGAPTDETTAMRQDVATLKIALSSAFDGQTFREYRAGSAGMSGQSDEAVAEGRETLSREALSRAPRFDASAFEAWKATQPKEATDKKSDEELKTMFFARNAGK